MTSHRIPALLAGLVLLGAAPAHTTTTTAAPTPSSALSELKAGNERFASNKVTHPHQTTARRSELVTSQQPHAVILACADSRVAPEIVFDKGLGDLFTVRVAGNIAGDPEIASIEYAVEHLHVPLIVVMGHQSCGAVGAAIEGGEAPGHLPGLLAQIKPSVEKARGMQGELSDNAVRVNVETVVSELTASHPILAEHIAEGKLKIVGGVYSLKTGRVAWLPEIKP